MAYYELTPAYSRDYKNKAEVIADFRKGKDFNGDYQLQFKYCSIRDFKPGDHVMLRYKRNTMVTDYKVTQADLDALESTGAPSPDKP